VYGLVGVIVAVIAIVRGSKTESGKLALDTIVLKLPVFGNIIKKVSVAKFSRTFSTLVKSGGPYS